MSASRLNEALILLRETDDNSKQVGLKQIKQILDEDRASLTKLGHDLVIFKRLTNIVTFETNLTLSLALDIIEVHYFNDSKLHDELVELLMMRHIRSIDYDTSRQCLEKLSKLIDLLGCDIAKHSKHILKMSDLNTMPSLNDVLLDILTKLEKYLPKRRDFKE